MEELLCNFSRMSCIATALVGKHSSTLMRLIKAFEFSHRKALPWCARRASMDDGELQWLRSW